MSNDARRAAAPVHRDPDAIGLSMPSMTVIAPDDDRRRALSRALSSHQVAITRELKRYPQIEELALIAKEEHNAIIVDLAPDPERALDVIENLCGHSGSFTVVAYAPQRDPELLVRCMRAGAREFLHDPLSSGSIAEALVRASARRDEMRRQKRPLGRLYVFVGAKGGCGVTTVATNFAVALAMQSAEKVALVDLNVQLGDAALTLALANRFSIVDALENPDRLDSDFVSVLMSKHASGLSVLAASDSFTNSRMPYSDTELDRVLRIVRQDFGYVVADAGSHNTEIFEAVFKLATTVYLVTQVGITELRNANRLIGQYFAGEDGSRLEVVLNRYLPRNRDFDDGAVEKALTRPVKWKIPNDFAAVRKAQNSGTPVVAEKNAIAHSMSDMARAVSGQTDILEKRKMFSLFG